MEDAPLSAAALELAAGQAKPFLSLAWVFWSGALLYLPLVLLLRAAMRNRSPLSLRALLVAWNTALALLSMAIAYRLLPYAAHLLSSRGWTATLCRPRPYAFQLDPGIAWAFAAMTWSKLFELADTAFLVVRKKPLLFLHWFHHVTVLLFTWYCQVAARSHAPLFYTLMNAVVHALMYCYYAFAACRIFFPFPQLLTMLQLAQMVVGAVVAVQSGSCPEDATLYWAGIAMYSSYFALFLQFFLVKYFRKAEDREESCLPTRNHVSPYGREASCQHVSPFGDKKSA